MIDPEAIARRELIDGASVNGAWTREQLAEWGVPWPPPIGWRVNLIMHGIPYRADPLDRDDALSHDPRR